jgi:hypothetical protein
MSYLANQIDADVTISSVTLRSFTYQVAAIQPVTAELVLDEAGFLLAGEELAAALEGRPVDGIELTITPNDLGLTVSLRFERGEFVNLATAGLRILDAADATELPEGGETQ